MQFRGRKTAETGSSAGANRKATAFCAAAVTAAALAAVLPATAAVTSTFTPGEGTGAAWCPGYDGFNLGSYMDVYACTAKTKNAGKTPFDSYGGFQCTELANRYFYSVTGRTLFDNEEGGNFVALAAAAYSIADAQSGSPGILPAAGDIISMWGGRSGQKQNGSRTLVAIVTEVKATSSGWTITTLNQGDHSDTDGRRGFNTITVSAGGTSWSTEDGFYATFDWLKLADPSGGNGGGGNGGTSGTGGGTGTGAGTGSASWTATQAPLTGSALTGQLLAVACSSAADCTAVGVSGTLAMLVYRSAGTWKPAAVPLPSSSATDARLTAVACPSGSACLAAGQYRSSGRLQGMLLSGHGSAWTATMAPLPAKAAAEPDVSLAAVACTSASSCVAVGQYTGSSGSSYGLLVIGHGSSWTARQAPLPPDAAAHPHAQLASISCLASGCVAVGNYTDDAGNEQGLVVTGSGSSWIGTRAALPASAVTPGAVLSAVTCPATGDCVAVGSFSANQQGMVLTGWGTSWQATSTPLPAGAAADPAATFHQIFCSGTTACLAVGSYAAGTGGNHGLLLSGHGSTWTAASARLPSGAAADQGTPGASVISVACATASICVAAGHYTDTAGDARVLLLSWHGASFGATRAPLPANDRTVGSQAQGALGPPLLAAVTCPSAVTCIAVGTYPARTPGMEGLVETGQV
jgi:hypothetical protein